MVQVKTRCSSDGSATGNGSGNALENPVSVSRGLGKSSVHIMVSNRTHPKGLNTRDLVALLEFGSPSNNQPARPVFGPFQEDLVKGKIEAIDDFVKDYLESIDLGK